MQTFAWFYKVFKRLKASFYLARRMNSWCGGRFRKSLGSRFGDPAASGIAG